MASLARDKLVKCDSCGEHRELWDAYWELDGAQDDVVSIEVYADRGNGPEIERFYCEPCLHTAVEDLLWHLC